MVCFHTPNLHTPSRKPIMATKRNPEERAVGGPDTGPAQPTGEEVAGEKSAAAPRRTQAKETAPPAPEPATAADVQALASEYYGRLTEITEQLNGQARALYASCAGYARKHPGTSFLGAVALGALVGFLTNRD